MVKITYLPPGKALGADDLKNWGFNRTLGRWGVSGKRQREADIDARRMAKYARRRERAVAKERLKEQKRRLKPKKWEAKNLDPQGLWLSLEENKAQQGSPPWYDDPDCK